MKYGKLDENAKKAAKRKSETVPQQPTEMESRPMINEMQDETEQELFMETEKKLKSNSTIKNVLCGCCGFIVLLLIAGFVGYVFQEQINADHALHDDTNTNTSYFIVSPTDTERQFALITLNNSLQILLISDHKTDKSAAAIDVAIGSSEDPMQYLGLAHFHEHMLFLGSESYPTEDAFSGYVSMNGGHDNAYTDNTHTNFFFEINNDHLSHALDIFSRFFMDPLLTFDGIMGEIWAVDNEYRKDIPNEEWREWRMLEYSAHTKDPFSQFLIGSVDTLNKSGIYDAMKTFHDTYFVANLMKGVIYGNQDIDTLKSYAEQYFSGILSSDIEAPTYEDTEPFTDKEKGMIYLIRSIDSTKKLSFVWSFVGDTYDLHRNYRSPGIDLIHTLWTSKTNNSLYDYLSKSKGWINDIDGETFYDEYHWNGYSLSLELTETGLNNYQEIAKYVFQYIRLLLENIDELEASFQDYKCLQSIQFKFYSLIKQDAYDTVSDIARRMQYREQSDLLYTALNVPPSRLVYDEPLMLNILYYMYDPDHVIIYRISDDDDEYDLMEPYFGIEFAKMDISNELKDEWTTVEEESPLSITFTNPYIDNECNVDDIALIDLTADTDYDKEPELFMNESNIRVWYKPDTQFNTPQIAINILLISPLISTNILHKTYTMIWMKLIEYVSSEWYSQPNEAGYTFEIDTNNQGIMIGITCINSEYLETFLSELLHYILNIEQHITVAQSDLIVTNILNNLYDTYNNINYESIWYQGYYVKRDIMNKPYYSHYVMLNEISDLLQTNRTNVLHNVLRFVAEVKEYGWLMEVLFHGNLYRRDLEKYLSKVSNDIYLRERECCLESDNFVDNIEMIMSNHLNLRSNDNITQWIFEGYNSNIKDTNDVNEFYFQFNENSDHLETCNVLLIGKMMSSESFEVLRTQEALGYVATTFSMSSVSSNNINYVVIVVASGHYSANYLHQRVLHFAEYFYDSFLSQVTEESFASYVNATISDVNKEFLMLSDETEFLWNEIVGHTYFWNKRNELEQILRSEQITLEKVTQFYGNNMLGESKKWLSVQLYSDRNTTFGNNITQNNYTLNGQQFKHQFVYFNSTKDLQGVYDITFFNVY